MKVTNLVIGVIVILAALMMFSVSIVAVSSETKAKGDCDISKMVENGDIDETIIVPFPSGEDIQDILESLDPEVQDTIIAWALENPEKADLIRALVDSIDEVQMVLDGKYHINAHVWERNGCGDANVHFHWKGSISISFLHYENGEVVDTLTIDMDVKCFQFILHLKDICIENNQICIDKVMVNTILRGEMSITSDLQVEYLPLELDLWSHLILKIQDGEVIMFKVWLPSWFGMLVATI
ncbi:MAG: hypothetical protein GKC03_01910 [Methanomassiliicoccales archaeon]|nr:hypothetical protein [Methanomassiliicoccales archaeon]NYT15682.1 hypothetical protein [Methanomassiliicoccales archaeon]